MQRTLHTQRTRVAGALSARTAPMLAPLKSLSSASFSSLKKRTFASQNKILNLRRNVIKMANAAVNILYTAARD